MPVLEQAGSENLNSVMAQTEKELYQLLSILDDTQEALCGPYPKDGEVSPISDSVISLATRIRSLAQSARVRAEGNLQSIGFQRNKEQFGKVICDVGSKQVAYR